MSSLLQSSASEESSSRTVIIVIAVLIIFAVMGGLAFLLRGKPQAASGPPPYATNMKLSDFKMSAADNFVGATVNYIDGSITNTGSQTVTGVTVEVTFKDEMGQLAQREDMPLQVMRSNGAYPEPVALAISPLAPGQSQPFRLTFESISAQWNHQYPEIQITGVTTK